MPTPHGADNLTHIMPNRPLRVCFVIDQLGKAGTETQLLMLIRHLDRQCVEPYLCLLDGRAETSRALEPNDCPILRLGVQRLRSLQAIRAARRFRSYLKENRIDIVQTYFVDSVRFAAPIARIAGCVSFGTRRNIGHWVTPKDRRLARFYNRWFIDKIIANCEACKQAVLEQEGISSDRVLVIPNGIELSQFDSITPWQPKPEGVPRIVGMVGNFRKIKGVDLFIHAAEKVLKLYPNTRFEIAGGGDKKPYQVLIDQLGLAEHIHLLGSVEAIPRFLSTLDVAVLPSRAEGLSNALLEYMTSGCPIVATNVGGTPELITPDQTGLLVEPENADALADAILRLLKDATLSARLAENAKQATTQKLSAATITARYQKTFVEHLQDC